MNKILSVKTASEIAKKIKRENKKIVITGGCFDILHLGHIKLLENAKKEGDILFVLLESDENVKRLKGENRPINSQKDRAQILSSLTSVDFVVLLEKMQNDEDYDNLIVGLKPDVLATTANDPAISHKKRQAEKTGAKIVSVVNHIPKKSTSDLAKIISKDFEL